MPVKSTPLTAAALSLLLCLLSSVLCGCFSHNVHVYGAIDPTNKTMTVPTGGYLTGAIKHALASDGWMLTTSRGPDMTEGRMGSDTRLQQFQSFNTRYVLNIWWHKMLDAYPRYNYNISVVDTRTGSEVLTMSGNGPESDIVKRFMASLSATR